MKPARKMAASEPLLSHATYRPVPAGHTYLCGKVAGGSPEIFAEVRAWFCYGRNAIALTQYADRLDRWRVQVLN